MADTNALVKLEQSANVAITSAATLTERIREWQTVAHVLTPAIHVSALAPQHAVNVAVVKISAETDDRGIGDDTYGLPKQGKGLPWLGQGERAIGKVGLLKIAAAAGISWDPDRSGRTDDRKERYYWEYQAVGTYIGFDGRPQTLIGTFELDLRDGSPALKGFSPAQIDATRRSGLRICESKAMNAAIRTLGLKQKYTVQELQKPFVILRTSFIPDMNDPMQRQMVAERALGSSRVLYPSPRPALPDPDTIDVEPVRGETIVQPDGSTVNTRTGEVTGPERPAKPEPVLPTGPIITAIRKQDGKTRDQVDERGNVLKKGGRPFTRHFITLDDGTELHTFDAGIGELAAKLMAEKAPIEFASEKGKWGEDITELKRAEPRLPLDDDGPTDADLSKL